MSQASRFLHALAQGVSALSLYPDGHTSRERALDHAFQALFDLIAHDRHPSFTFLDDSVVYQDLPMREFDGWDWSGRFSRIGVQRLEISHEVTREELERFLDDVVAKLQHRYQDTAEADQMREAAIQYGTVGLEGAAGLGEDLRTATIDYSLGEEVDAIRWIHEEVTQGRQMPLLEAETVVRGLTVAMHGDQQIILPLLRLRRFDEYTTTHAMNVSVLSMGLAEWLGLGSKDVRAFGIAGLLHDLGKVTIPLEVLNKAGKLTERERKVMNAHPTEGAKLILETEHDLDLAAVVAYEHHIMLNGGGYPKVKYERDCHYGSKLVHVCDVYDALRTKRPYRDAWAADKVLAYLEERSGTEFDGHIAHAFTRMMHEWEPQLAQITEDDLVPASVAGSEANSADQS